MRVSIIGFAFDSWGYWVGLGFRVLGVGLKAKGVEFCLYFSLRV